MRGNRYFRRPEGEITRGYNLITILLWDLGGPLGGGPAKAGR